MKDAIADGVDVFGYTSWGYNDMISASNQPNLKNGMGTSTLTRTTWAEGQNVA